MIGCIGIAPLLSVAAEVAEPEKTTDPSCAFGDLADCTHRCDAGEAASCTTLATMYAQGQGVRSDAGRALTLVEGPCDGGDARACAVLGVLYAMGQGVKADPARAVSLFERGCDDGVAFACFNLGLLYTQGQGVKADPARAVSFFERGCDGGHADACYNLGAIYVDSRGVTSDLARAVGPLQRACDGGHADACYNLGLLYARGRGVHADPTRAAALYKQACETGSKDACAAKVGGDPRRGKRAQFVFLFLALLVPCLILVTLVVCLRTRALRRKWLWALFIVVGLADVSMNWSTGEMQASLLTVQLLGASLMRRLEPNAPWILSVGFPLGAVLFWGRRMSRRARELVIALAVHAIASPVWMVQAFVWNGKISESVILVVALAVCLVYFGVAVAIVMWWRRDRTKLYVTPLVTGAIAFLPLLLLLLPWRRFRRALVPSLPSADVAGDGAEV